MQAEPRLTLLDPSEKANTPTEAEAEPVSAIATTQEKIDRILQRGPPTSNGKLLTASAAVDENAVTMLPDSESPNALAPLTVINTRGFDLPQTGGHGNWIYPAIGITLMVIAGAMLLMMRRKK